MPIARVPPSVALCAVALSWAALTGCKRPIKNETSRAPKVAVEARREVEAADGYAGPIDPEWPPRAATEISAALRASRIVREAANASKTHKIPSTEQGDLHVESGQIGVFPYLEVIVGKIAHPDDPLPLVVLLHGRGNRPQIPQGPLEAGVPFRMFLPQAPDPLGDGFTWLAVPTNSENTQLFTRSLVGRLDQLAPAIQAFRRLRPTLGKPIVIGFSQGAILTFGLVTRYPSHFAAGFPIAGWLPPELYPHAAPGRPYPYIFAQHGSSDSIVPKASGDATVAALRRRGLRVDYRTAKGVGHVVTPEMSDEVRRGVRRILRTFEGNVRSR